MSRHPNGSTDRRHPLLDRLRGLLALLVIVALVVGIPLALYALRGNPLPDSGTDLSELLDRLKAPDTDGSLFLGALTWIGWLAWASLTLTVLVEVVAQLRGLPAPHLPALGPQQAIAAGLVATTALLFALPMLTATPARAASDTPRTGTPTTVSTTVSGSVSGPSADVDAPAAAPNLTPAQEHTRPSAHAHAATRSYTVQPGDTLWKIAEDQLGDGARFPEIAQLNYGAPQDDGHALTAAHWLTPGWKLQLPQTPEASPAPATAAHDASVVVEPGDTLWQIAQDQLGDGARFPEIAAASTDLQPDGHRLVDPDLIRPGWTLHLPGAAASSAPAAPPAAAHPPAAVPPTSLTPPAPAPTAAPLPSAPAHDPATQAPATRAPAAEQTPAAPDAPAATSAQDPAQDVEQAPVNVRTAGGIGALLAASVLLVLGRKRMRQQRRRRPGQRIAMPPPDLQVPELELRMVEDPTGLKRVDQALRSLSVLLAEHGRPLPVLRLARLVGEDLELYLDGSDELPAPFTSTWDPAVWTLPADADLLSHEALLDVPAPFPSLVTLGHDLADAHVLVDLEHAGTLAVDGDPDVGIAVLAAVAAELATSRWADNLQVTVVGCLAELPGAVSDRIRHVDTLDELLPSLEHRAAAIRQFMADSQVPDLQHARSAGSTQPDTGAWCPEILLLGGPVDTDHRARLQDLLQDLPRVSLAAVTAAGEATPAEWTLVLDRQDHGPDDTAVLHPVNLSLRPQLLTSADLEQLLALLAVTELPAFDPPRHPGQPALNQTEMTLAEIGSQLDGPASIELRIPRPSSDDDPGHAPATGATDAGVTVDPPLDTPAAPAAEVLDLNTDPVPADVVGPTGTVDPPLDTPAAPAAEVLDLDTDPLPADVVGPLGTVDDPATAASVNAGSPVLPPPLVQLLGPVTVLHTRGELDRGRRAQLAELAAIIALNPGIDHDQLDQMKWPKSAILERTRNNAMYYLRKWLGDAGPKDPYVPYVNSEGYRFRADVKSDWDLWQSRLPHGPEAATTEDLAAALELVKGQPFAGAKLHTYAWAEVAKQTMISAIVDAAATLARRALSYGPPDTALAKQAIAIGLQVDPGAECLWRYKLRAQHAAGDREAVEATARELRDNALRFDDELEPETDDLINELLAPIGR